MIIKCFEYYKQPTGNTCGPTCIYMVLNYLINKSNSIPFNVEISTTIEEITEVCTTDWTVGTPPKKMILGFEHYNIPYKHHLGDLLPYGLITTILSNGNIPILRTITQDTPHWIIVNGYDDKNYYVLDPWLGEIKYTKQQLEKIWSLRDYECFEIITNEY